MVKNGAIYLTRAGGSVIIPSAIEQGPVGMRGRVELLKAEVPAKRGHI